MSGEAPAISQFYLDPWVDMPQDVMYKFPSLREWNRIQSLRWTALQDKFQQLSRALQELEENKNGD